MNVLFFQTTKEGAVNRTLTHYADNEKALIALYGGMRASINDTKCERYERTVQPVEESEGEGNE